MDGRASTARTRASPAPWMPSPAACAWPGPARRRRRPLPHLVHPPGRLPGQAAHGRPAVLTTHSLEPHRPWKVEQLGTAYHASSWVERTAYRERRRRDRRLGGDARGRPRALTASPTRRSASSTTASTWTSTGRRRDPAVLAQLRRSTRTSPYVLFVGRITRQKGIIHLVNAIKRLRPGVQVVLCAGAPDTQEIGREMAERGRAGAPRARRPDHLDPRRSCPKDEIIPLYTHAALFVCPSVYEPFGIINLEAMACGRRWSPRRSAGSRRWSSPARPACSSTPACAPAPSIRPTRPPSPPGWPRRSTGVAEDAGLRRPFCRGWAPRVQDHFSWDAIAQRTAALPRVIV